MVNSKTKQKVKVKTILPPIVASVFFIVLALFVTVNNDLLYLSGNSVTSNYMCPTTYKLSGNKCKKTINATIKGDINADGIIDNNDVLMVQNHLNNISILINDNFKLADVDGDGKITLIDLNKIRLYSKGLTNKSGYLCLNDYKLSNNKCYKEEDAIKIDDGSYNVGDAILYNDDYWYILKNNEDFITLLKSNPLDDIGTNSNLVNYNNVDTLLNLYSQNINEDLKEVNGYKIRLITIDELKELGFVDKTNTLYFEESSITPYWIRISNENYFVMKNNINSTGNIFMVNDYNNKSYIYETSITNTLGLVRPVINVYKDKIK